MLRKPTLETVAKLAGVSIPTVSQALRGTGRISEETRRKVIAAAQQLHYLTDQKAASMRSGENREVGFVINQLSNPFNAEVISGVVDLLEAEGYLVSILDTRDDANRQRQQLESFIRHGRGGLLWVPTVGTDDTTYSLLKAHRVPTVTFLRNVSPSFDHVGIRNAEATYQATQHLINQGHKAVAYLGGTQMTLVRRERIAGYQKCLSDNSRSKPLVWDSEDNKLAGLTSMNELLKAHPEVSAIVCNGDMVALGACLALQRMGFVPGREVSVIGFDDIQDAEAATPRLTTMAVSPVKLGRKLAQVLLARIREPDMPVTVSEVSAELIIRETTGPSQNAVVSQ
jgi:LacI family transcriptional regulator